MIFRCDSISQQLVGQSVIHSFRLRACFHWYPPNKLTKLGRCDSYTIEWLNNSSARLQDCWACKLGLIGMLKLPGLLQLAGWAGSVPTSTYKYLKVPRSTSKYQEVPQSTKKYFKVPRSNSSIQKYPQST